MTTEVIGPIELRSFADAHHIVDRYGQLLVYLIATDDRESCPTMKRYDIRFACGGFGRHSCRYCDADDVFDVAEEEATEDSTSTPQSPH